jgi:hypothetical protein
LRNASIVRSSPRLNAWGELEENAMPAAKKVAKVAKAAKAPAKTAKAPSAAAKKGSDKKK